jgi:hypothetical protein
MGHDMCPLVITCPLRHFIFLNLKKKKKKNLTWDMTYAHMT